MPNLAYWNPDRQTNARAWYPPVGVQPVAVPLLQVPAAAPIAASADGSLITAPSPEPCHRCAVRPAPAVIHGTSLPAAALSLSAAAPVVEASAPAWWVKREWWLVAAVVAAFLVLGSKQ